MVYGGVAYEWLRRCLWYWQLFTVVDRAVSSLARNTFGVPQELYVNDIANAVPDQTNKLFADDTNLFIASKNPCLLNSTVNDAVNKLNIWFIANRLGLNLDKACYIAFLPHKIDSNVYFNVQLDGANINKVKSI